MINSYQIIRNFSIFILFFCGLQSSFSQEEKEVDTTFNKNSKTFLAIPVISNNPAMKTGFGGLGMYFFKVNKEDKVSPPSLISLYAIYTTNNSYILAPFARLFWNENKNRATFGTAFVRINNDFSYEGDDGGEDVRLVYTENRKFFTAEFSKKVVGDFYAGLLYLGTITNYSFNNGSDEENEFTEEFFKQNGIEDNFVSSIGANLSFDSRDYPYYPTQGLSASVTPKVNTAWLGSENEYVAIDYRYASYHSFAENKILAIGVTGGFSFGDVPFDAYKNYGTRNSLRGYEAGKYKGRNMVAAQAEYRWRFYKRWGAVAFAGAGSVWGNDNSGEESFERGLLPSAGVGVRYMVSKQKKTNIRLDYAIGVDGNEGLYFGVMESF